MRIEIILIIALAVSVILLSVFLLIRVKREKQLPGLLGKMNLPEFSDFLRSNSSVGNIQAVAGKVSTLLTTLFGCSKIIFLRKKRGLLELNFYHGIKNFNRSDFRIRFSNKLGGLFSEDFLPRNVNKLKSVVSEEFLLMLDKLGLDTYFPVYWRSNLYGVYFVSSNLETKSPSFTLLVASLAHSLSAAYHIKWHESRYLNLEKKLETNALKKEKTSPKEASPDLVSEDLLALAKIRNSDKLLKAVMEPLSRRLGTSKVVLAHISGKHNSSGLQRPPKTKNSFSTPADSVLEHLLKMVKGNSPQPLNEINSQNETLDRWLEEVQSSGFTHALEFDLDPSEKGVLLWECHGQPGQVKNQLIQFRSYASDLMTTAKAYEIAEELSFTDALTGLANQRYLYKRLREEISRAKRFKRHLAFVLFDLDELKTVNDSFGHQAGDMVLRQVGQSLKKSIREIDIIARYGGDEFCVIMPEADSQTCAKFMDRILKTISKTRIMLENSSEPLYCTVSLGGAVFPIHASDGKSLVYKADMALLRAKNRGRNRYIMYAAESAENLS